MVNWWIGCSGFHYKHWKGPFYPETLAKSKWFDFYNNRFKTLELNVTFYRFPRLPALQKWYEQTPDTFRFSVKAPRSITHYRQFVNTSQMLADFYGITREGLKDKLGCILFQMPAKTAFTEAKLQQMIESVDRSFINVFEFRNPSWWKQEVYEKLAANAITFCGMSHPMLPVNVVVNTGIVYYRFHGIPELYKSKYNSETLQNTFNEIHSNANTKEAFVYFNNDIDAAAITNAFQMQSYMERMETGTEAAL